MNEKKLVKYRMVNVESSMPENVKKVRASKLHNLFRLYLGVLELHTYWQRFNRYSFNMSFKLVKVNQQEQAEIYEISYTKYTLNSNSLFITVIMP